MFGHKAPTPCCNWLGLTQCNNSESISEKSRVQRQYELVWATNKWALKASDIVHRKVPKDKIVNCWTFQRVTWFCCKITQRGTKRYRKNTKKLNWSWFTGTQSLMSMTLNQSMVWAQCVLLTDATYRILREPKKVKDLRILMLLIKGCNYPLIIPK